MVNNNSLICRPTTYSGSGTFLRNSHVSFHLIFVKLLWSSYYYSAQLACEEMGTKRLAHPRTHSWEVIRVKTQFNLTFCFFNHHDIMTHNMNKKHNMKIICFHFMFIRWILLLEIVIFGARSNTALSDSRAGVFLVSHANTGPCLSALDSWIVHRQLLLWCVSLREQDVLEENCHLSLTGF